MAKKTKKTPVKKRRPLGALTEIAKVLDRTPLPLAQGLPKAPQLEPSRSLLPKNEF